VYFHVWFVTKYRKPILDSEIEKKLVDYFLEIAKNKDYNILEMETNRDHVHMLLEAQDRRELWNTMRVLKSVSAKKIQDGTPHLRVGNARHFWAKRYGYREIDEDEIGYIRKYIRDQKKIPHT
jgi:putative transposase